MILINIYQYMLGRIDFRNARYQGEISNNRPHGLGIAIDNNHLFCLAQWNQGKIQGSIFVIFPDLKIFCGRMRDSQLSDLSCFYLPEKIQTYINYAKGDQYSQKFITVLPMYRIILQIDCGNERSPRARRYQNYQQQNNNQQMQLNKIFGQSHDITEFQTWQTFLIQNFISPQKKHLFWEERYQENYYQFFIGIKKKGLGVKLIEFHKQNNQITIKSPILVSSMGEFTNQHEIQGYGLKMTDFTLYHEIEEGYYDLTSKNTIKYHLNQRPEEAYKQVSRYLRQSLYFKNDCLNFNFLYKLQQIYSKIGVELVEETQKIAQVILHNNEDSELVLAEIQKKREKGRRKSSIKPEREKSRVQIQPQNPPSRVDENSQETKTVKNSPPPKLTNPEVKLTDAQRSIYSSVQKIKKQSPERLTKATQQYINLFGDLSRKNGFMIEKNPSKVLVSRVNESPPPRNGIFQERHKFKVEALHPKKEQDTKLTRDNSYQKLIQNRYYRDAELQLYRKQKEIELNNLNTRQQPSVNMNNRKYQDLSEIQNYHRSNYEYVTETHPDYRDNIYSSKSHSKSPISKYNNKDESFVENYSKVKQKLKQRQQQMDYFKNMLNRSREMRKSSTHKDIYDESKVTKVEGQQRVKTPGKIRVMKRKEIPEFEQFNP